MKTFVQPGDVVTLTSPTGGITSGSGLLVGALFGVAAYDAAEGAEVEVAVVGVYTLPKASGQITEGQRVWWSTANSNVVNATGVGLFPIGTAVKAAATGDATVRVRLDGVATVAAGA